MADMDIDTYSKAGEEEQGKGKTMVVILIGPPGSGKSTFCEEVMRFSTRPWVRICQDNIANGKAGTKAQCIKSATTALNDGKSVFIDRCNLDREQRAEFVKLGDPKVDMHAVVLDLPARLCISRSVKRTGHEGNLQGGRAAAVVNRMLQNKEFPKLSEGFTRITFCQNESDVEGAINTYSALGPLDTPPKGVFSQKKSDAKVQLGIMKFFKKSEPAESDNVGSVATSDPNSAFLKKNEEKDSCFKGPVSFSDNAATEINEHKDPMEGVNRDVSVSLDDAPTLAFPSISTSDFQFNHEKASAIIVEKVEEFLDRIGNARLVLVDLTHRSKILSLVKEKASKRNIDSNKFFTFVGDITRLYSQGGLRCNVIANAANWRLKPGGGGVNAAIFSAAGPALEVATKEQTNSLLPGNALVVSLPSNSPLFGQEGVTHVIHVLGPNMNPQRPNCLKNDYATGCKILRDAYTSLFEGFASIVRKLPQGSNDNLCSKQSEIQRRDETAPKNSEPKFRRDDDHESDRSKKYKESHVENKVSNSRAGRIHQSGESSDRTATKAWGSWAQALYHIAKQPDNHKEVVLEMSDDIVVLNDLYPKARKHLLVLTRFESLEQLADAHEEHLPLLRKMHNVGLRWTETLLQEDASLIFRLGYHSAPSMRQLHLHVISQDFNSKHLKNKKHWNSFTTAFFRDSVDVMEEVSSHRKVRLGDDEKLLSMELRCHRCRSAHPNIPRLKSHITSCNVPFPANLLQKGRLVSALNNAIINP
ncbi:transcription factor bHLH140 isoform X2 [Humulus lupulus]|uniref:transcription factor bHLH140 isoform X2 n=1 Tax=Humulus lupulus TaxID=3486 RepID=UPI002B410F07|nr:transcription factor bHLH140 isoform X2 [Humulus lupulus]